MMSSNVKGLEIDAKKQQENQPVQQKAFGDAKKQQENQPMQQQAFGADEKQNRLLISGTPATSMITPEQASSESFERERQKLKYVVKERMRRSNINFQKHLDSFFDNQKELFQECKVLVSMVEKFKVSTEEILKKHNQRGPEFMIVLDAVKKLRERQLWYWIVQKKVHFPSGEDFYIKSILNVPSESFMDASKRRVIEASKEVAALMFDWIQQELSYCTRLYNKYFNYEQRLLLSQEFITIFKMMDVTIENRERHMDSPSTKFSPIEFPIESIVEETKNINHGIPLVLELKNTYLVQSILVGVVVHATPPEEHLEFYFFNARDMAICVGVSLEEAKVTICNDLSITIEDTSVSEWLELQATWLPFVRDNSCHLVMEVQMETPAATTGTQANQEQRSPLKTYGVGFECDAIYVDKTYDVGEGSWPLLYDMALFILTSNAVQCDDTKGESSGQGGSGSFQGTNQDNDMACRLQEKRDNESRRKNSQGGEGDGDEDRSRYNQSVLEDDEQVSKIIVIPTPLSYGDTNLKPNPPGLESSAIAPTLVFTFRRNTVMKRISIETQTQLGLSSTRKLFSDEYMFGWYHNDIEISFGCQGGAQLENNSSKISDVETSDTYNAGKSISSTKATTITIGGEAQFNLFGSGLKGSSSGSYMEKGATNASVNIERQRKCVCNGFSFINASNAISPACAKFQLFFPLYNLSIWGSDREFLRSQGLFSTIEPSIAGRWMARDENDTAPYFFKVKRLLKLQRRGGYFSEEKEQDYYLPFYVNHAMTHLHTIQGSEPRVLHGNQTAVRDVLDIGTVGSAEVLEL